MNGAIHPDATRPVQLGRRSLASLALLALAVRCLHLFAMRGDILFSVAVGDGPAYLETARAVARGEWVGPSVFEQAPLYPYLLGIAMMFGAGELMTLRVLQALLGAATCALLAAAATRLFRNRRVGHGTGLGLALYAPAVHYESLIDKTALAAFLVALLALALARFQDQRRWVDASLASVALAGLALTRENLLLLLPAVALWILCGWRAQPFGRRAAWVAVLACGPVAALALSAAHNQAASGELVFGRAQLGANLWIGNHEGADGLYTPMQSGRGSFRQEGSDARRLAEERAGRSLGAREVSKSWIHLASSWLTANPAAALALYAKKLRWIASDREWMDAASYEVFRDRSWLLKGLGIPFRFGLLLPLALFGMFSRRWPRERWALPFLWVGVALLSLLPFFVLGRFRLPLAMSLLPFAVVALLELPALRQRRSRALLASGASLVALVIAFLPVGDVERPLSDTWVEVGSVLREQDRSEEALAAFRTAVAADPDNAEANFNLGLVLVEGGEVADARALLERAARKVPEWRHEARILLINAYLARQTQSDSQKARKLLNALQAESPHQATLWVEIGRLERVMGRIDAAEDAYRRALALDPGQADAHNNLGWLLASQDREEEAARHFEQALQRDPNHLRALINLGWLRARASRIELRDGREAKRLAQQAARQLGDRNPELAELFEAAEVELLRQQSD